MPYVIHEPPSSPCNTIVGEFTSSMGNGNAHPSPYTPNMNENDALDECKTGVHKPQSVHSSCRPWRHRRLTSLMRRQNTILSDTSTLSEDSSQALATSSISGPMSSVSPPQGALGSSFPHPKTPTNGASSTSPVSASDTSTLGIFSASASLGGSPTGTTRPGNTRPLTPTTSDPSSITDTTSFSSVQSTSSQTSSLLGNSSRSSTSTTRPDNTRSLTPTASDPSSITDTTSFSSVQSTSSQTSSLLGNPSRSPTRARESLTTSLTSWKVPQSALPSTTDGPLTTNSPNPSTTVQTISQKTSGSMGLSTGLSVTLASLSQGDANMTISTDITTPPSNTSSMMVSTSTTSGSSSLETLTTINPTSTLTSDSTSTSVIASSTSISTVTTINISSNVTDSSTEPIASSSGDDRPKFSSTDFIEPFSTTSGLPASRPTPITVSHTSVHFLSTSTSTRYQTITSANGATIIFSTVVESGVLNSDKPRPDDNAFAHNTGGIIGVAVSGTFVVIVTLIIMFLSCQKYRRGRERDRRNITASGSRENFLRRELELDPDIPSQTPTDHYVTIRQQAGPGSEPFNLSPHDGHGGGGGSDENGSAESAGMYPVESHASPPVGGMDTYTSAPIVIPGSSGVPNSNETRRLHTASSSDNITHQALVGSSTAGMPMGSPTRVTFSPTYVYPYENPQQSMGPSDSDPSGDAHGGAVSSTSGHGHYSTDGHTTSVCFGSSSHGHTLNNFGALTSSSEHTMSMSTGGMMTSSSGHGMGAGMGITSPWNRPKSGQAPPSSYIPPRHGSGESTESSGSNSSSSNSLLGKLRSMTKLKSKRKEERNRRLSLQSENIRASMCQSSSELMTMSMGYGSILGHTALHQPPSSLLNPPNPPIAPVPPMPPVPTLRYPAMTARPKPFAYTSQPSNYPYIPPLPPHDPRYSIGVAISDSPYLDAWPPPISPSMASLVPTSTDASSYVEGLLNPNILPQPYGGARIPGVNRAGGAGPDDEVVDGSKDGEGVGRRSLWTNEYEGRSTMSLRDYLDYSRPISGALTTMEATRSTPTFGTDREVVEEA